ncbi:MAG: tetratricopeptide repeat protein [Chlamydiota bacterium]
MRCSKILSSFLFALIILSLIASPQSQIFATSIHIASESETNSLVEEPYLSSYDNILNMLDELEKGDLEERCSLEELENLNLYIASLARQGILSGEEEDETLEDDIQELLSLEVNPYGYAYSIYGGGEYVMTPAILYGQGDIVLCKSFWKKTKHFVKKHKKAIIIGAVIVVAAAAVAAAGAAASAPESHKKRTDEELGDSSFTQAVLEEEISSLKEFIHEEHFFETNPKFSLEENGRVLGQALAHQGLENRAEYSSNPYLSELKTKVMDQAFLSSDAYPIPVENLGMDFRENAYQLRGERSLDLRYNDQAILDLGQVIELNPNNHRAYLERAIAYEELGDHERSLADYQQYTVKKSAPLGQAIDFGFAFARAVPRGVKESGRQLGTFASELITHPITTAGEVGKAFALLAKLAYSQEWATIAETLAPEVCELVEVWDTLSPTEQGDRSGFVFGKYGTDIVIPGTIGKLVPKGVRLVREITSARKILGTAKRTLAFETGQSASKLSAIGSVEEFLPEKVLSPLEAFKKMEATLTPYRKQYIPEAQARELIHQAGGRTFPRPVGIPENFRVKIADKSGGMKYVHPTIEETYVRVMPGKLHSPFPYQQKPYVSQMKNGKYLDNFGNIVDRASPEAHISLEEFIYKE